MIKVIKLMNKRLQTYGGMQWGENITNRASGKGAKIDTDGVIHAYRTPLLAVFMDPAHTNYLSRGGIAFEAETPEIVADDGLKVGVKQLTTLRRIELPKVTLTQRVAFGMLHVLEVYKAVDWRKWADDWLSGKDRSAEAAWAALAGIAQVGVAEAVKKAYVAAAWVSRLAARTAEAADASTWAAWAAAEAAWAAVEASWAAARAASGGKINSAAIAEEAMKY